MQRAPMSTEGFAPESCPPRHGFIVHVRWAEVGDTKRSLDHARRRADGAEQPRHSRGHAGEGGTWPRSRLRSVASDETST